MDTMKIGNLRKGMTLRYFKGGVYQVLELAKDSETKEDVVVYQHVNTKEVWVRPLDMFMDKTDKVKYPNATQEYRFEMIL